MIPILLLSTIALFYHPVAEALPLEGLSEKDYEILANYRRFLSDAFVQNNLPFSESSFEAFASNEPGVVDHSISPDDFKIAYAVEGTFRAPNKGRVHLDLIEDQGGIILLHVDARYQSPGAGYPNTLIMNSNINVWGKEEYFNGFDFTPGIVVTLRVEVQDGSFRITSNGQEIGIFQFRVQDVSSVSSIRLRYRDNQAEQKAEILSLSIHYQ